MLTSRSKSVLREQGGEGTFVFYCGQEVGQWSMFPNAAQGLCGLNFPSAPKERESKLSYQLAHI